VVMKMTNKKETWTILISKRTSRARKNNELLKAFDGLKVIDCIFDIFCSK